MRKLFLSALFALLLIAPLLAALGPTPTLPVDSRKKEIQHYRSFEYLEIAPADTLWEEIDLPPKTVAVHLLSLADSVAVMADTLAALYTLDRNVTSGLPGLIISSFRGPTIIPVYRKTCIWIRRSVKNTASKVRVIFLKM